jgi:hypothetical protein
MEKTAEAFSRRRVFAFQWGDRAIPDPGIYLRLKPHIFSARRNSRSRKFTFNHQFPNRRVAQTNPIQDLSFADEAQHISLGHDWRRARDRVLRGIALVVFFTVEFSL